MILEPDPPPTTNERMTETWLALYVVAAVAAIVAVALALGTIGPGLFSRMAAAPCAFPGDRPEQVVYRYLERVETNGAPECWSPGRGPSDASGIAKPDADAELMGFAVLGGAPGREVATETASLLVGISWRLPESSSASSSNYVWISVRRQSDGRWTIDDVVERAASSTGSLFSAEQTRLTVLPQSAVRIGIAPLALGATPDPASPGEVWFFGHAPGVTSGRPCPPGSAIRQLVTMGADDGYPGTLIGCFYPDGTIARP